MRLNIKLIILIAAAGLLGGCSIYPKTGQLKREITIKSNAQITQIYVYFDNQWYEIHHSEKLK